MSVLKYKDPITGEWKTVGTGGGGSGETTLVGDNYVTAFGAVGDGTADDTEAFRAALAEKRAVFVPGGTYKLTGGIVIGDNCELELSQDTVLQFDNVDGNCITLGMSSSLKGNHATVKVPYAFSGNVIYASTTTSDDVLAVPPFTKWDPQWKSGRYVTDINICKADSRGFHYSVNGECSGTAVYISAEGEKEVETSLTFMWGVHYSGLRIAGAFKYGIHAENFHEGWNHEMRLEAFIDACEIGVFLKDCSNAYVSAAVQPRRAYSTSGVYKPYAKHGIVLTRSRNADLSGSRVWDWNETHSLWAIGNEYQHIAMYGDCRGLILNDYLYYETSYDIRDLIYTDTPSNLEKMTILQEPITRWFKPKEGMPYFSDGVVEKRITTVEELASYFDTDLVKGYTDVLATAFTSKDDPSVFKGKGYGRGYVDTSGVLHDNDPYLTCTGYIPVKQGQTIYAEGLNFKTVNDECRIVGYNANFEKVWHRNRGLLLTGTDYYAKYTETANGFSIRIEGDEKDNVTYVRFNFETKDISDTPLMSVDEEIKYTVEGFLADGVKVKAENVIGGGGGSSGGVEPLIGTTDEITPSMVIEALQAGRQILLTHTDEEYGLGEISFSGFGFLASDDGDTGNVLISTPIIADNTPATSIQLVGIDTLDEWQLSFILLGGVGNDTGGGGSGIDVTAEVGQTIVVKEVDENGKPTAWEAVDLPSGFTERKLIHSFTLEEQVDSVTLQVPQSSFNGSTEFEIVMDIKKADKVTTEDTASGKLKIVWNNYSNTTLDDAVPTGNIGYISFVKSRIRVTYANFIMNNHAILKETLVSPQNQNATLKVTNSIIQCSFAKGNGATISGDYPFGSGSTFKVYLLNAKE